MINAVVLGRRMAGWRKQAGLTQAELAQQIGTKQSVISRVEAGRSLPKLPFLMRFAEATGQKQLVLNVTEPRPSLSPKARRERVRQVLGDYVFNPWERDPTPAEARTLNADGLTRELLDRTEASSADEERTVEEVAGPGKARIIGLDDLYLDRLRQSTIDEHQEGVEFNSALAAVAARHDEIDWSYVADRIRAEGALGQVMKRIDSRIRRRVRDRQGAADQ